MKAVSKTFVALGAIIVTISSPSDVIAQTTYTWQSSGGDGNWTRGNNAGPRWESGGLWDAPSAGNILNFNNNTGFLDTTNNVGSYSVNGLNFGSSATTAREVSGNALGMFDFGGNNPFIRNESSGTHTISINLNTDSDGADPLEVWLDGSGGLTFGGLITNNSTINLGGGTTTANNTIRFNNVVSGNGGMYVNNADIIVLMDAANTQNGQLTINAGTVRLNGSGDTFGSSSQHIKIGTNAVLDLNNVSTTVASVGEESNNDGGTISLGSATLTVSGNTNTFQSGISGTGSLVKSGAGTLNLYGSQTYSGSTTVSNGILSSGVAMSTASVAVEGGTFRTTAADVLGNSVGVTVNSGTYSVGGSDTIGVLSGSGGTVTVTNGTLTTSFNGASNNFAGVVSGAGSLTKAGTGTLSFSGGSANTISGVLTVSEGELIFNKTAGTNAVGGDVSVSSGATLRTLAANQFGGNLATIDGTLNLADNNQSLALRGTGTVSLGSATLTNNVGVSDTFSGHITGTGAVVKAGAGEAFFAGSNNYTGLTTVSAGSLEIQDAYALGTTAAGTTVSDGAVLKLFNASSMTVAENITINGTTGNGSLENVGGSNTVSGTITLGLNSRIGSTGGGSLQLGAINANNRVLFMGTTNNITVTGAISGTGATEGGTTTTLYKDGAATLTLSGNNTYSGDTRVTQGTLTVAAGGTMGNGTSDVFVSSGANININTNTEIASLREAGSFDAGTNTIATGATLTVSGDDYSANSASIRGSGNLVKSGSGTMVLVGTQDRTGSTTINNGRLQTEGAMSTTSVLVSGGTFATTGANVLTDSTSVTVNSGTYSVGGSDTIGVLSGSGGAVDITSGNALTTSFNSASNSYSGAITGDGAFAKAGSGTLTLSGANTKGGANTVSGGKLTVQSGGSLAGATTVQSGATLVADGTLSGAVSVNSGATLEGGGSVGTLTINGVLAPGNSAGITTATGGSFWNQGGSYEWEIFNLSGPAGTGWDLLSVSGGALDLNGITSDNGFTINLITLTSGNTTAGALTGFNPTATYTNWLIASAPSISGFVATEFNLDSSGFVGATGTFGIEQRAIDGGQGLFITYDGGGSEAIPEPGTWAAAALLAGAAAYVRLRRRKKQQDA